MTFWVVPAENFREQRNVWKGNLFFRTEYSKPKFVFRFFKAMFNTGFRPSRSFFGKWNWFVQMVNATQGRNLPVRNFAYHLPKPWTDQFAYVNGKQPLFGKNLFSRPSLLWSKVIAFFGVYMSDFEKPCKNMKINWRCLRRFTTSLPNKVEKRYNAAHFLLSL